MTTKLDDYTPDRFEGDYFRFLVDTKPCASCKRPTIPIPVSYTAARPFPAYHRVDLKRQAERAGVLAVGTYVNENPVCVECVKAGVLLFGCAICGEKKNMSHIEESFGYPAEHLCKQCYQTVPAAKWDAKRKELEEAHRWDNE